MLSVFSKLERKMSKHQTFDLQKNTEKKRHCLKKDIMNRKKKKIKFCKMHLKMGQHFKGHSISNILVTQHLQDFMIFSFCLRNFLKKWSVWVAHGIFYAPNLLHQPYIYFQFHISSKTHISSLLHKC